MNIFLTGGSGFIGRNIIEAMSGKYNIIAPTHAGLELTDADAVADFFRKNEIDVVIHSAVKPGHRNAKDPAGLLYGNTRMFFNLVRNSKRFGRMILLSSGLVYDMRHYLPKMKEEYFDVHVPVDEAGFSKYIAACHTERADNILELRIFGIFGKYEDYAIRFISNMICKAIFDLPLTMHQNRRFDYIHINDLIPVLDYFMTNNARYKAYNVTPDESVELRGLAEKVIAVSGKDLPVVTALEGLGIEYSGDNARLRTEIPGWRPAPIDLSIERLYDWYSGNRHLINRDFLLQDK